MTGISTYIQYFCGESHFQYKFLCDPSDFVHFCKRIVEEGIEKIFTHSVELYGKETRQNLQCHKSFTVCIAKGKTHKQYGFDNKTGIMVNPKNMVILAVKSYEGNTHDSKTIEPLLNQIKENLNYQPSEVIYDRGGRGKVTINDVIISTSKPPLKRDGRYDKLKKRREFRIRAAIESVIEHLKKDFRMEQNYLTGSNSPQINALLTATGWNLKKLMKKLKQELLLLYFSREKILIKFINQNYFALDFG